MRDATARTAAIWAAWWHAAMTAVAPRHAARVAWHRDRAVARVARIRRARVAALWCRAWVDAAWRRPHDARVTAHVHRAVARLLDARHRV